MVDLTFNEMVKKVDSLIQKMGGYWSPLSMLAAIVEETGELAREINAYEKFKPKKKTIQQNEFHQNSSDNIIQNIGEELADILYALICVGNYFNIDISDFFSKAIEKYESRDKNRFN